MPRRIQQRDLFVLVFLSRAVHLLEFEDSDLKKNESQQVEIPSLWSIFEIWSISWPEVVFEHTGLLVADMVPFQTAVLFAYALLR